MKLPILLLIFLHYTHALFITAPLAIPSPSAIPGSSLHVSSTTSNIPPPLLPPSKSPSSLNSISTILTPTTTQTAEATITPKPSFKPGDEVELMTLHQKWHITTYWSCATLGKDRVFCGWHEPVRPGGDEIAAANPGLDLDVRTKVAALAAGALAVVFAALL